MTPRSLIAWSLGPAIVTLAGLTCPISCLAAAQYTFTDLGPADGGYKTFDAQGQVNPGTTAGEIRPQSGPYSISSHYTDVSRQNLGGEIPQELLQRALANTVGQAPVQIDPPGSDPFGYFKSINASPPGGNYQLTFASAVNASGTYVGSAFEGRYGVLGQAIEFTRDGGSVVVPTPSTLVAPPIVGNLSAALSINDAGLIVGTSDNRAFLSDGKSSWDLNTLLVHPESNILLTSATDINDMGQILAIAVNQDDQRTYWTHYVLLTPTTTATPEPATVLLLGAGCLLYLRKRRSHRMAANS